MSEIDEILEKYTSPVAGSLHGATFIVVNGKREEIYARSFGSRTADGSEPLTPDALGWMASLTKLATAISAMQIVEKGMIGLDDDVREVVPKLKDLKIIVGWEGGDETVDTDEKDDDVFNRGDESGELKNPKGHPVFKNVEGKITLRQLLTNSGGFCYDLTRPLLVKWSQSIGRKDNMFSGNIDGIHHPLSYEPGMSWEYGPGIDWAGQVVEALTSLSLEDYMQKNIWEPLGCENSTFYPKTHFFAVPSMQEMAIIDPPHPPRKGNLMWMFEPRDAMGGAGLFSTAKDYSKLLRTLLEDNQPLLEKMSVEELFAPQFTSNSASLVALNANLVESEESINVWRAYPSRGSGDSDDYEIKINHSIGGVVVLNDVPGRRKAGSLNWSGLPNLHWWVDREAGIAGVFFTQAQPMKSQLITDIFLELEAAVYRTLQL